MQAIRRYRKENNVEENNAAINMLQQEQMLKLITKTFYKELIKYGVNENAIIKISCHLLDHLIQKDGNLDENIRYYNRDFTIDSIEDEWSNNRQLTVEDVRISMLEPGMYAQVALWLRNPAIKYNFISMFPDSESELKSYFEHSSRNYFGIFHDNMFVGIIGADNIDNNSQKIEMRKFVGDTSLQGKGIGKKATFLFLYYAFVILKVNKVYIYSGDLNIANLNLNSKFGFELEGVLFEEIINQNKKQDIIRMSLLKPKWKQIFSNGK